MSLVELPHLPFVSLALGLVLGASLWGCGADDTTGAPSPDASTGEAGPDEGPDASSGSDAAVGDDTLEDAPAQGADAGDCTGVRCAAPPPCDQPCTSPCCCSNRSCPAADGGVDGAAPPSDGGAPARDSGGGDGAACTGAGDCRLFSDMCGTCTCLALAASAATPTCPTPPTECFKAPCAGLTAACQGGHCVAQTP